MKKINYERYADKLQRVCLDEITEVQKTIEATFTDLEINLYITQREVADEIDRIYETYEKFFGFISKCFIGEIMKILTEDEQETEVVIWSLVTSYLLLDELKFSICTPVLEMNEKAIDNLLFLEKEFGVDFNDIDFFVFDAEENEITNVDSNIDYEI